MPPSYLFTCWCLPVKFAGWSKNSCVNGFGGVIKSRYTRGRRKGEECFIFGWGLFNFYWKNGPFQGSLKQRALSIVSSTAPIATGERQLLWTGLTASGNEMSFNLPLTVLDI